MVGGWLSNQHYSGYSGHNDLLFLNSAFII
jgi:hypothetical protein